MTYKTNKEAVKSVVRSEAGVSVQAHSDQLYDLSTLNIASEAGKAVAVNSTGDGFVTATIPESLIGKTVVVGMSFSLTDGWDADEALFTFVANEALTIKVGLPKSHFVIEREDDILSGVVLFHNDVQVATIDFGVDNEPTITAAADVVLAEGDILKIRSTTAARFDAASITLGAYRVVTYVNS